MGRFDHRKATVKVQIKDAAGNPLKNTEIRAEQKTQSWLCWRGHPNADHF